MIMLYSFFFLSVLGKYLAVSHLYAMVQVNKDNTSTK